MNDIEFREQYKRLRECHPNIFAPKEKMDTIWYYVKDLDLNWFKKIVNHIVMANDVRSEKYDIGAAAIAEMRSRKAQEFANNVIKMSELVSKRMSADGLENTLKHYGANSLLDAVEKSRKGEL